MCRRTAAIKSLLVSCSAYLLLSQYNEVFQSGTRLVEDIFISHVPDHPLQPYHGFAHPTSSTCHETNPNPVGPLNTDGTIDYYKGKKIIVVGLPKAGTTSLLHFFSEAWNQTSNSVHWSYKSDGEQFYIGSCMKAAVASNLPPIKTCGDFDVYAQMDYVGPPGQSKESLGDGNVWKDCYFPQIFAMEHIHREHPDAIFILNMRDPIPWATSVTNWKNLPNRLSSCAGGPQNNSTQSLVDWYCEHTNRIRNFVKDHPSHVLIEVNITSPAAGSYLSKLFGIDESHWHQRNKNENLKSVKGQLSRDENTTISKIQSGMKTINEKGKGGKKQKFRRRTEKESTMSTSVQQRKVNKNKTKKPKKNEHHDNNNLHRRFQMI